MKKSKNAFNDRRILYILHRGLCDIRLLGQAGKRKQVHDLADMLEILPVWLGWEPKKGHGRISPTELKIDFQAYEKKYPQAFKYSDYIDRYEPPPIF